MDILPSYQPKAHLLSFVFSLHYKKGKRKGEEGKKLKKKEKGTDHLFNSGKWKSSVKCSPYVYDKSTSQAPFCGFCLTVQFSPLTKHSLWVSSCLQWLKTFRCDRSFSDCLWLPMSRRRQWLLLCERLCSSNNESCWVAALYLCSWWVKSSHLVTASDTMTVMLAGSIPIAGIAARHMLIMPCS